METNDIIFLIFMFASISFIPFLCTIGMAKKWRELWKNRDALMYGGRDSYARKYTFNLYVRTKRGTKEVLGYIDVYADGSDMSFYDRVSHEIMSFPPQRWRFKKKFRQYLMDQVCVDERFPKKRKEFTDMISEN